MNQEPYQKQTKSSKKKTLKRRFKHFFTRPLLKVLLLILPPLYYAYMKFVWNTSKIEYYGVNLVLNRRSKFGGAIVALWHETVFFQAYSFREFNVSTLASVGNIGELITRILKLCNFEVFRGGSSNGNKSRKVAVLSTLIEYMQTHDYVIYGITVDGSSGPRRHCKSGVLRIAQETGNPLYVFHTGASPCFRFPSWDKMVIPLPFSRIVHIIHGPFFCPKNATDKEVKILQEEINSALMETVERTEHYLKTGEYLSAKIPPHQFQEEPDFRCGENVVYSGEHFSPLPNKMCQNQTSNH